MYISPLFVKSMKYAKSLEPDIIFILSAEYGLVDLDDRIQPYEKTFNGARKAVRLEWTNRVLKQLRAKTDLKNDRFVFLASKNYREFLLPHIKHYTIPMERLPIGKQLGWLGEQVNE